MNIMKTILNCVIIVLNIIYVIRYLIDGLYNFILRYMHVIVLPKTNRGVTSNTGTDDAWLPQWAVAVMVIGLASLLFVLIFGITVVFIHFFIQTLLSEIWY